MDPLTIASTAIQIGTALDSASSQARQAREMARAIRERKAQLETRKNINILNRQVQGQKERSQISSNLQSSGLANADGEMLASSMQTEFNDLRTITMEADWEKKQAEREAQQYDKRSSAAMQGGILSALGSAANAGINEYKNNPEFAKGVQDWWLNNSSWSI